MILVWHDAKSFNRHLEYTRCFQQFHRAFEKRDWNIIKDMPFARDIHIPLSDGGARCSFDLSPGAMVIPLWKIVLPGFMRN